MKSNRPWLSLLSELYAPPSPEERRRQNEAYGDLLVDLGLATRDQVDDCLASPPQDGRPFPPLARLLIDRGILTRGQLAGSVIASAAEDPDNRIGRHVLVGRLRGETWKAWDTERRDWAELTFLSREEQVRLWPRAAVSHPGLARLLELGSEDGRTFVAAEHVAGVTLAAMPRDDRGMLLAAVRDAAEAVAALHERKLVHGGLSLETIVLDAHGKVRVTGWGADDRDVPALGAALYELLTDRPAPNGGLPEPWPKRLSEQLRVVLTKALRSEYAGAGDFARDLGRL